MFGGSGDRPAHLMRPPMVRVSARPRLPSRPLAHTPRDAWRRDAIGRGGLTEQFLSQRASRIGCLVPAAALQLGERPTSANVSGRATKASRRDRSRRSKLQADRRPWRGDPTTTGPIPPIETCSATSRTVQRLSGSARVIFSSAFMRGPQGIEAAKIYSLHN